MPCTTLDGVKFRTRAGAGRCQGGFCGPRVVDIIHRELGIPMEQVTKKGGGSYLLSGPSKDPLLGQAACRCGDLGEQDVCRIETREREEVGRHAHGRV